MVHVGWGHRHQTHQFMPIHENHLYDWAYDSIDVIQICSGDNDQWISMNKMAVPYSTRHLFRGSCAARVRVKLSLALLWYGLYHSSWAPGCFTNNAHTAPVNIPWIFYSVILMTWVPLYDFPKVNQVTLRNMDTVHKDQVIRHIDVPVPSITNGMCAIKYSRKTHSRTTITHCM